MKVVDKLTGECKLGKWEGFCVNLLCVKTLPM